MDTTLYPTQVSKCVLQCVHLWPWMVCVQGGPGCYFLLSGRHESSEIFMPLISLHKCTKLSPPYHGRKTPTTNKKNSSQQLTAFVEIPQGGKSEQEEKKKSPLSPTNTSWSPGQSWICMGLPDNWALSRQKPMLHSPDRNSVNPQSLILTPPLACRSHKAPNNQVTTLIVTITQHLHSNKMHHPVTHGNKRNWCILLNKVHSVHENHPFLVGMKNRLQKKFLSFHL